MNLESETNVALVDVQNEVDRARAVHPHNEHLLAALAEEVGELAKALLEESGARVRREAIQVACVAIRIAVEGDRAFDNWRKSKGFTDGLSRVSRQ